MLYFFYYFPLGLDLRLERRPWATWALLAACGLGFLVQRTAPAILWAHYENLVFVPAVPRLSALVLNAYLHGGWLHLASNMITLLVFGPALEQRLGVRRYLLLYHLTNVLANVVQGAMVLLFLPMQARYGVLGASGAIAGLMGIFLVRLYFAHLRVGYWAFMPLQAFTRWGAVMVPSAFAIALWFVIQFGMALIQLQGAAAGIACGSHLGGLIGGIGLAVLLHLQDEARAEQYLHHGRRYFDQASWYAAQGEFIEYVRRRPQNEEGHLLLARTYRLTGRHPLADQHYRTACHLLAAGKRFERVEEIWLEAERGSPGFALDAGTQMQLAQLLERCFKADAARRAYLALVQHHPQAAEAPLALYRAASLLQRDPAQAWQSNAVLTRLVEDYPFSAEAGLARSELARLERAA